MDIIDESDSDNKPYQYYSDADSPWKHTYLEYFGGLGRCGKDDEFVKTAWDTATYWATTAGGAIISTDSEGVVTRSPSDHSQGIFTGKVWLFQGWADTEKVTIRILDSGDNLVKEEERKLEFDGRTSTDIPRTIPTIYNPDGTDDATKFHT